MTSIPRSPLPCALVLVATATTARAAPQIEYEGRLFLSATPGSIGSDGVVRFFDVDGDGRTDFAYGGDDTDQSYLTVRVDRGNGAFEAVYRRTFLDYVDPSAIAAGDLDGDGDREVVYASPLQQRLVVLSLAPTGLYVETAHFPIQGAYAGLETADLDGDGDVDVAAVRGASLLVHWNVGGTFPAAPTELAIAAGASALALGDLDGDGDMDAIATGSSAAAAVAVVRNQGGGSFATFVAYPCSAPTNTLALADFDGDGALDVATGMPLTASIAVLRNLGNGDLAPFVASPAGVASRTLDAGDLNGDGAPDLVVAGGNGVIGTGGVAVLAYVGAGAFAPPVVYGTSTSRGAAATDLDGDGDLDLAIVDHDALRNRGDGTFAADAFEPTPIPFSRLLAASDLDGDGDEDLVLSGYYELAVRENRGDGTFANPIALVNGQPVTALRIADADGDGDVDLVVGAAHSGSGVRVFVQQSALSFVPVTIPGGANVAIDEVEVADLDGDARPDVVVQIGSTFRVALGSGAASWAPLVTIAGVSAASYGHALALADVDGDGDTDFLTSQPNGTSVHANLGALAFAPPVAITPLATVGRILAGDLDADGDVDVVVSDPSPTSVLWNLGAGAFAAAAPIGPSTSLVGAEDLDHDGDLDVLGLHWDSHADVFERNGAASFAAVLRVGNAASETVAAIDVDGDGDEELLGISQQRLFVLDNRTRTGSALCAGDGGGTACPCGNASAPGAELGCLNSTGRAGEIEASGSSSLRTDTLRLHGAGMTNSAALYFQGTTSVANGAGTVFGDGLRCVAGTVVRLAVVFNVAGRSTLPSATQPPLRVLGQVTTPGTRLYQVWYRDAAPFCTPATWNLTNAVRVTWSP